METNVLRRVQSKSDPGKQYEVRLGKDGVVYCTCPAWRFGKGKPCKHLVEFGMTAGTVAVATV